ncbi:MAG: metal ABC transporter permease [Planctomycetota bacterium]
MNLAPLIEIVTLRAGFNTNLVIVGAALLGTASGVVGSFALLRKRALVTDALSHAMLPGIAAAFLLAAAFGGKGRSVLVLSIGAAATAVLAVLTIQAIVRYTRLHADAAVATTLGVFFGAGVVGLSVVQNEAASGSGGINGFLFGQAATMTPSEVRSMAAIAAVSIFAVLLFQKELAAVGFDDGFVRATGWPVGTIDLVGMAAIVLVTVAGTQAVGVVLVIALVVIPPAAARFWTDRLTVLLAASGGIGAASGVAGAAISSTAPGLPAGSIIVLTAAALFAISLLVAPRRGLLAVAVRRIVLRIRTARDHLLEAAHEHAAASPDRAPLLPHASVRTLARLRGWSPLHRRVVIASLRRRGLVDAVTREGITLSQLGRERGARIARNHALWEQYLVSHADIAPSHVDWSVDQVEHVLSPELVDRLERELGLTRRAQAGAAS